MTNHPGRRREQAAETAQPPEGRPAALGGNAGKLIGSIVASAVENTLAQLPEMFAGAMAAVLSRVPVQAVTRQLLCAPCALRRLAWDTRHAREVAEAEQAANEALAALAPDNPQRERLSVLMFLPPGLRPDANVTVDPDSDPMPEPNVGVVMVAGTVYCAVCAPGEVPQPEPARAPLLVAHGSLPPGALRGGV